MLTTLGLEMYMTSNKDDRFTWQPDEIVWLGPEPGASLQQPEPDTDDRHTILWTLDHVVTKADLVAALPSVEAYLTAYPQDTQVVAELTKVTERVRHGT